MRKIIIIILLATGLLTYRESKSFIVALIPMLAGSTSSTMVSFLTLTAGVGIISQMQHQKLNFKLKRAQNDALKDSVESTINSPLLKKGNKACETCQGIKEESRAKYQCSKNVEECCKDFFDKFKGQYTKHDGGFRIFKDRQKKKELCCLEFDYVHGGFEIFDHNQNHLGERGCDDMNDDPCEWSRSRQTHAEPNSDKHKPRSVTCQK